MLRRETFSYLKLTFYVPTTSFYDVYIVHCITVISDFNDVISMHVYQFMERPDILNNDVVYRLFQFNS